MIIFLLTSLSSFPSVASSVEATRIRRFLVDSVFHSQEILSFSLKINGEGRKELPERVLGVVRHVRLSSSLKPLVFRYSLPSSQHERHSSGSVGWRGLLSGQFTADAVSSITSIVSPAPYSRQHSTAVPIATVDPIEKGVNQVIDVLDTL